MSAVIGVPEVLDLLDQIVAEKGADTVADCYYTNRGYALACGDSTPEKVEPMCIAGQLAYKLGGEEAVLSLVEHTVVDGIVENAYDSANIRNNRAVMFNLGLTAEALRTLRAVQRLQDEDETWGTAVQEVRKSVE
jgi:hypothetical protein